MAPLYTPKAAADAVGISPAAVRKYAELYARFLSTEAGGSPRSFTAADLTVFAFVARSTALGRTHAVIQSDLAAGEAGEFAVFDWSPPGEDVPSQEDAGGGALVPAAQLQAVRAMLDDAKRREQDARAIADAQADQLRTLTRELGRMEAEIDALRRDAEDLAERRRKDAAELAERRRPWWIRLWGGS